MPPEETGKQKTWTASLEKPVFNISENNPINGLHYHWRSKQELRYDMHYGLELGVLLKGKMRRHFKGTSFDIGRGETWLCGMWEPHGYQITHPPCEAVVLIIFPPVLSKAPFDSNHDVRLLTPFDAPPDSRPATQPSLKKKMISLAEDIKSIINTQPENKYVWLNLKVTEILLRLMDGWDVPEITNEKYSYPTVKISEAIKLIFENKGFVSTQKAARISGMNRNAFGKFFRDTMGITFSEFGLRYRISATAELLRNTDRPIKAIALEWGFTDTSHLHRCIEKYYNCSPTEYRKTSMGRCGTSSFTRKQQ